MRGNRGFAGQFKACVRRRAELSVKMSPNCTESQVRLIRTVPTKKTEQDSTSSHRRKEKKNSKHDLVDGGQKRQVLERISDHLCTCCIL